ncbi:hypothetical protein JK364_45085 [Streptomyces sp. 110]|uniref:Uncharacterized protein n=1 Tax=Streptomyces endocoffeicus TaxID=2898945 RepID=A0ABS1Q539_9ACTN|nr:hypothetical protein [Streptomyces endocoffeicus]MBL1119475.1 hypothetical protein [Streptomyces endocoffeicus]
MAALRTSSSSEDDPMESDACEALSSLIRWKSSLDGLIDAANRCDLREGPCVRLDRDAVRDVLQRCISGELDVLELPRWAGAVHMLDRVEIDEADVEMLSQFLFEASSPELFEPINVDLCQRWISRMGNA